VRPLPLKGDRVMRSRTVCVTGGAGFIGSHVAEALVRAGHRVLIVDDLSTGRKENVPDGAELHQLDIRSEAAAALMARAGIELLVHHAAQIDVRRSVADPRFDADVNIGGTLNLLEAGRKAALREVVFASTGGAIYGEQDYFPADEQHPTRPMSPYGVAKLAAERYLFYYHTVYGLDVTCLRYANVYGPRQSPHGEAGVVAIFLDRLLAGQVAVINGDGLQTRDYVFVGDVVAANLAAVGLAGFNILNVGTGVESSVVEVYALLDTALGTARPPRHGEAKPGEQRRSVINAALLEQRTGVRVGTSLAVGLQRTAEWFRKRAAGDKR
jgi:UDP-glucose 4-epimerase